MAGDAKDKADAANGNEENPDEIITGGETQVAPDVGVDATSTNEQFLQMGSAQASQEAKGSGATFEKGIVIATISDPDDAYARFDKDGKIKSLGSWGGDFILVTTKNKDLTYFRNRGLNTIIPLKEMVYLG